MRAPAGAGALSMSADIDVKEYIKIFGRLGEKMIFGDASAGLCCHSACENCEWRYSFDVMQSGACWLSRGAVGGGGRRREGRLSGCVE